MSLAYNPSCDNPCDVSWPLTLDTHRILTDQLTAASVLPLLLLRPSEFLTPVLFFPRIYAFRIKQQLHMRSISSTLNAQGAHQSLAQCFSTLQANNYNHLQEEDIVDHDVSFSGFLVLVTVAVNGQRRFGAGHMNQMFDRMQRAQQDSYGEIVIVMVEGSTDSLIGVNSFQNKFSTWPFPRQ